MNSSPQSPLERAKAQVSQLDQRLETERQKFRNVVKEHETHINCLKQSFEESQQSITLEVENTLKVSAENSVDLERKLQEEEQRVAELTRKLDKAENNETKLELASEKISHGNTKKALVLSNCELTEAKKRIASLQKHSHTATEQFSLLEKYCTTLERSNSEQLTKLEAANAKKVYLGVTLEVTRSEATSLQERLKAAEQKIVDLTADLKAANGRASGAQDELEAFKSRFKRINEEMAALACCPQQQPIAAQLMSSAAAPNEQVIVGHTEARPQMDDPLQTDDPLARPQRLDPQASNAKGDKESNLSYCNIILNEVMDTTKNWESNRYFLKAVDSLTLASHDAKVGPMTLGTLKEKLANGGYDSVASFKADFNRMITDASRMNPPENPVRIAAGKLSKIFDQAFSSQPVPGHEPRETSQSAQLRNGVKRKAGIDCVDLTEDGHTQKRRPLASADQGITDTQIVNPATGGSLVPALPSQDQPKENKSEQSGAYRVGARLTAGKRLGIDSTLSSTAQLVSFAKSPSTITGDWKSLLPQEYWITTHTMPSAVEKRISYLVRDAEMDVIVLRLTPSTEADVPEFDRILGYLLEKKRFATISHAGIKNVESIDLIPASKAAAYPEFFSALDFDLLPRAETEDVLFMAVVFFVGKDKQRQVRTAWNERMAAIRSGDKDGLQAMRKVLARNHLHIFQSSRMLLSSAERHLAKLSELPLSEDLAGPELRAYDQCILRLSYNQRQQNVPCVVDGVWAPKWVFVLGRVNDMGRSHGLLVVDVQAKNRPVWLIRHFLDKAPTRRTITLLAGKFPGSLDEWQRSIPPWLHTMSRHKCLENTGVMLERCRFRA